MTEEENSNNNELLEVAKSNLKETLKRLEDTRKENAKLIDKLNLQNQRLNELKLQLEVASKRIDTSSSANIVLSNRIEKMKNCNNCKHYFKKKQRCFFYEMYSKDKKECLENHKSWELAE
ncbi:MAG: hypothetical protein MJ066_05495 [Clostridia bacterium]|nr:hypothetical protein [Clostridia bacterium]